MAIGRKLDVQDKPPVRPRRRHHLASRDVPDIQLACPVAGDKRRAIGRYRECVDDVVMEKGRCGLPGSKPKVSPFPTAAVKAIRRWMVLSQQSTNQQPVSIPKLAPRWRNCWPLGSRATRIDRSSCAATKRAGVKPYSPRAGLLAREHSQGSKARDPSHRT